MGHLKLRMEASILNILQQKGKSQHDEYYGSSLWRYVFLKYVAKNNVKYGSQK